MAKYTSKFTGPEIDARLTKTESDIQYYLITTEDYSVDGETGDITFTTEATSKILNKQYLVYMDAGAFDESYANFLVELTNNLFLVGGVNGFINIPIIISSEGASFFVYAQIRNQQLSLSDFSVNSFFFNPWEINEISIHNTDHGNTYYFPTINNEEIMDAIGSGKDFYLLNTPEEIYEGSNTTSYNWNSLQGYHLIIMTGYRYGGPDNLNVCQVIFSPSAFLNANKTYITVPLAMVQTSDNQPTFWTGGLRLNIAGNNLVWKTSEYSGQYDFGVFRIEGIK